MVYFSPLTNCPACRYSLRGLPTGYRCPECGFEFDADTIVFQLLSAWPNFVRIWVFLTPTVVLFGLVSLAPFTLMGGTGMKSAIIVSITVASAVLMLRIIAATRHLRFVALCNDRLEIRCFGRTHRIPWADIKTVSRDGRLERANGGNSPLLAMACSDLELPSLSDAINAVVRAGPDQRGHWRCPQAMRESLIARFGERVRGPLNRTGVLATVTGLVAINMIVIIASCIAFLPVQLRRPTRIASAIVFCIGIVLLIAGQWRSDPRATKFADDDIRST